MRKIFAIILLSAAAALGAAEPEFAGEAAPGVAEALGAEARELAGFFRASWNASPVKLTVMFSPAVPEDAAEVQRSGAGYVLMLNGSQLIGSRSFALRRKVRSVLLVAAAGIAPPSGESAALPPWLAAALDHWLKARHGEERLLVGNVRFPVLKALAEAETAPDFAAVRRVDPADLDPAARAWFEEFSRGVLISGGRKVASVEYLRFCAARSGPHPPVAEDDVAFVAPRGGKRDLSRAFEKLAWHNLSPRPARYTLKKFAELRKVKLPELDADGKPVAGKFEECDLTEIGEKLSGRPDAVELAGELRRRIFNFAAGDSRRVRNAIIALAEAAGAAADPPFRYRAKLERAIETVIAELKRREKTDAYAAEADLRRAPVRRAFGTRLRSIDFYNRNASLLSAEGREWLDRREGLFL